VLAGIFAVDVLSFAIMSNHLHVVARTRPDLVKTWSDEEVALRWWNLFPQRRRKDRSPEEPTEFELNQIRNDASGLKEKRKRLSNVSWFMKCLAEPIARLGNKEEKVTGHFWEGRFKAQPLLDETAIAACMVYVDLNPIRAGIAKTPEASDFTSVKERVADRQSASSVSSAMLRMCGLSMDRKPAGWPRCLWSRLERRFARRPVPGELRTRAAWRCRWISICSCWTGRAVNYERTNAVRFRRSLIRCWIVCSAVPRVGWIL
jgi:REP element-mobilizing transposase RayT